MHLRKIAPVAGIALMSVSLLAGCGGGGGGSNATANGGSGGACSLVDAPDPGNSEAPSGVPTADKAPKLAGKSSYTVAFSQNASNNPWRLAETASMKQEAAAHGIQLTVTDANNEQSKQIADIKGLIAQKPDALFIAPITEQIGNVVKEAAAANIPVFLLDRDVDHNVAKPGEDFVTVIQSDFVQEGKRAAVQMAKATGGNATIIELEGTTGASPAIDRKKGFDEAIKECSGMQVVVSQDGDFTRAKGQSVAETLLQSHPDATAIYAHNDEMALGAIAAVKAIGKVPGKDIMVVSIDGEKDGLKAVDAGELFATVECSPRFGTLGFQTLTDYAGGKPVPTLIVNQDQLFTKDNAGANVDKAY
ncbi:MAG: sugar transporter substrate-binding protein [Marmoricola sp.]|nr:sugar transporter substrate-binding protein [Marmoricola sp.]